MGMRIPVSAASSDKEPHIQYVDVGTNIDCSAQITEEGRYRLEINIERSSIYAAWGGSKTTDWRPGDQPLSLQPILRQFRALTEMLMRDAQTIESVLGSDPLTGHLWKAEVTLNVLK